MLNEDQIVDQLKKVIDMSGTRTDSCIGVLTSDNRDNWAKAYDLLSQGTNVSILHFAFKFCFIVTLPI